MNSMKFKVTSGPFKRFVHVEMLISELESLFGTLNVETHTDPGLFRIVVYVTIKRIGDGRGYPSKQEVEAWWKLTDKSGTLYKIERIDW